MESKKAEKGREHQQLKFGQQMKRAGGGGVGKKSEKCHLRNQEMNGLSNGRGQFKQMPEKAQLRQGLSVSIVSPS